MSLSKSTRDSFGSTSRAIMTPPHAPHFGVAQIGGSVEVDRNAPLEPVPRPHIMQ
jgi:hypothetical protein